MNIRALHKCYCELKAALASISLTPWPQWDPGPKGDDWDQGDPGVAWPKWDKGDPANVELCAWPFVDETNRAWWLNGTWSPIYTSNSGTLTQERSSLSIETSPPCITDMKYDLKFWDVLTYLRRCRMYFWVDMRILVNGTQVILKTYDSYEYKDERTQSPDNTLEYEMTTLGSSTWIRLAIPASSTIEFQVRDRYNFNAMQTQGYGRVISSLRAQASMVYIPRNLVTNIS